MLVVYECFCCLEALQYDHTLLCFISVAEPNIRDNYLTERRCGDSTSHAEGWLTHALLVLCSWFCGKAMHMARDTGWSKLLTPGQEGKKVEETGTGVLSSLQEHMLHAPIGLKSSINLLS